MRKSWKIIAAFTILAVLVVAYFLGSNKDKTNTPGPRAVETVIVKAQDLRPGRSLAGIVKPLKEAKLAFQVGGRLRGSIPAEGTPVAEGMSLASIDPADYQTQAEAAAAQVEVAQAGIQQASAVLEQARASYQKAQLDFDRIKSLYEAGAVSKAQYDDAGTQLAVASARNTEAQAAYHDGEGASVADYHKAQAMASQSRLQIGHTSLKAPFKGTVLMKMGEYGEMVSPGSPVVVIGFLDEVKIENTLSASELKDWQEGDPVKVTSPDLPDRTWEGTVQRIHPAVDQQTGTFLLEVSVANQDHALKPGMVARAESRRVTEAAVWIPLGALVKRGPETTVFVIRDGKSFSRKITAGEISGNEICVQTGLSPEEELVIRGALYLHDGDLVLPQKSKDN